MSPKALTSDGPLSPQVFHILISPVAAGQIGIAPEPLVACGADPGDGRRVGVVLPRAPGDGGGSG